MNLITLDEYKVAKQLSADTKNDVRIGFLIESVSNLIKAYIKANISSEETITETILLDYDTDKIFLNKYPISSVESITETSPRYTTDSTIHVPLTGAIDYSVDLVNGIITRIVSEGGFATWPVNPGNVIVEYTNGSAWTSDSVPADLKLAAMGLVDYYKDEEYRQSKTVQGTSVVNTLASGTDFPQHIQVILDRYI